MGPGAAVALLALVSLASGLDPHRERSQSSELEPGYSSVRKTLRSVDCLRVARAGISRPADEDDFLVQHAPRDVLLPLPREISLLVANSSHAALGAAHDADESAPLFLDPSFRFVVDAGAASDVLVDAMERYCIVIFGMDHSAEVRSLPATPPGFRGG